MKEPMKLSYIHCESASVWGIQKGAEGGTF